MKTILAATATLVVFGVGSAAFATTVTWDFDGAVTYVRGRLDDLPPVGRVFFFCGQESNWRLFAWLTSRSHVVSSISPRRLSAWTTS
jgi:hypothetical protein